MNTPTAAIIIIGLVIYILYLTQCNHPKPADPKIIRVDTQAILKKYQVHTVPRVDTIYRPGKTVYKDTGKVTTIPGSPVFVDRRVEVPAVIDTQAIIGDYYSRVVQKDSFVNEMARIYITDTVYKNRITGRVWDVGVVSQVITKTLASRMIYVQGGFYNSKTTLLEGVHADLGYINLKGQHFKVGALRMNKDWHYDITFGQTLWRSKR